MPLLLIPLLLLAIVAILLLSIPFGLFQRYRAGTSRRRARGWMLSLNFYIVAFSVFVFFVTAAISNNWVPNALVYVAAGFSAGCLIGVLGLVTTRWEPTPRGLYYTPNRLLALLLTLLVLSRIIYGLWLGWERWRATTETTSWVVGVGVAGSMGAGALILGYYLAYWFGLRRRFRQVAGPERSNPGRR